MVKHIIIWKLKDELTAEKREDVKKGIKENLESLSGKIEGLLEIKVYTDGLASSNADLMLDSSFVSADALKFYATHPEHVYVADTFVRPFTALRSCFDYEI